MMTAGWRYALFVLFASLASFLLSPGHSAIAARFLLSAALSLPLPYFLL
jgi:hypothetical protein